MQHLCQVLQWKWTAVHTSQVGCDSRKRHFIIVQWHVCTSVLYVFGTFCFSILGHFWILFFGSLVQWSFRNSKFTLSTFIFPCLNGMYTPFSHWSGICVTLCFKRQYNWSISIIFWVFVTELNWTTTPLDVFLSTPAPSQIFFPTHRHGAYSLSVIPHLPPVIPSEFPA